MRRPGPRPPRAVVPSLSLAQTFLQAFAGTWGRRATSLPPPDLAARSATTATERRDFGEIPGWNDILDYARPWATSLQRAAHQTLMTGAAMCMVATGALSLGEPVVLLVSRLLSRPYQGSTWSAHK